VLEPVLEGAPWGSPTGRDPRVPTSCARRCAAPDQIELFCEVHLRAELGLDDGDPIAVWLNDG